MIEAKKIIKKKQGEKKQIFIINIIIDNFIQKSLFF